MARRFAVLASRAVAAKRHSRSLRGIFVARFVSAALVVPLIAGCGEPPRPHVAATPTARVGPRSATPFRTARWVNSGGATLIGPTMGGGTLVLVGGRRALALPDGTTQNEPVPGPEPLEELILVPTPNRAVVVARGKHGVYRIDEPLGAPIVLGRSKKRIDEIGSLPGAVAVRVNDKQRPRFVAVDEPKLLPASLFPYLPMQSVTFLDMRRGAAVFSAAGLATTVDGGRSWAIANADREGMAQRIDWLDGHLLVWRGCRDPAGATRQTHPLLRWIQATRRDPLAEAVTSGIVLPSGDALIAAEGLLARVDLLTGNVLELTEHDDLVGMYRCTTGQTDVAGWLGCWSEAGNFVAFPVNLSGDHPKPGPFAKSAAHPTVPLLQVSPSGGVLSPTHCLPGERTHACVRQPDGFFKSLDAQADLADRGAGPLANGSVAFVVGRTEEDNPSPQPTGTVPMSNDLHVVVVDPRGNRRDLAPLGLPRPQGGVDILSPIEEIADGSLRFVADSGDAPVVVWVGGHGEAGRYNRLAGFTNAWLHNRFGFAIGEHRLAASTDGGETFIAVTAPDEVFQDFPPKLPYYAGLNVTNTGVEMGSWLRIGWGTPGPQQEAQRALPTAGGQTQDRGYVELHGNDPFESMVGCRVVCFSTTASSALPPDLTGKGEVLVDARPPPGIRREHERLAGTFGRTPWGALAALDDEGPRAGAAPTVRTFRWVDPFAIGGHIQSVRVTPRGDAWKPRVGLVGVSSGQALFDSRTQTSCSVLRVRVGGPPEKADLPCEDAPGPSHTAEFGSGPSNAVAWVSARGISAWLPGSRPRALARIPSPSILALGTPTPDGIPVLIGAEDWAMTRVLPIPRTHGTADAPAPIPSIDGYTPQPRLAEPFGRLPICRRSSRGPRFVVASRTPLAVVIDGVAHTSLNPPDGEPALFDLRIDGAEVCLAGVRATFELGEHPSFARIDFIEDRAEGGTLGPNAKVSNLACVVKGL